MTRVTGFTFEGQLVIFVVGCGDMDDSALDDDKSGLEDKESTTADECYKDCVKEGCDSATCKEKCYKN